MLPAAVAGSKSRSAAHTGAVTSPDGEAYIVPKSPSLKSVPPMPGTKRSRGPPAVTRRTGGV